MGQVPLRYAPLPIRAVQTDQAIVQQLGRSPKVSRSIPRCMAVMPKFFLKALPQLAHRRADKYSCPLAAD